MTNSALPIPINKFVPFACTDPFACKLKVEGTGSVKVQPDMAVVTLGAVTENMQLKTAQEENATRINGIIETLNRMGISPEDIQTQAYAITPQYDYVEGKQVFRGYRVVHTLEVIIRDMDRIGEIIDEAVQNGANQVSGIRFTVSDPPRYYRQALEAAVDDALVKARTLGGKLNITVSPVPVRIIEEVYQAGGPIVPYSLQMAEAATQIQTGRIEITARIDAVFAYGARGPG